MIEHLTIKQDELNLILVVAKINTMIDKLNDLEQIVYDYLGIDYSFGEGGYPLIFETMVFPKKGDFQDLDMQRYSTLEEAKQGHEAMIKKYTN